MVTLKDFYVFASTNHDMATFMLCCLVVLVIATLMCVHRCWKVFLRHLNIRAKGWPPPHLDAGGNSIEEAVALQVAAKDAREESK